MSSTKGMSGYWLSIAALALLHGTTSGSKFLPLEATCNSSRTALKKLARVETKESNVHLLKKVTFTFLLLLFFEGGVGETLQAGEVLRDLHN